MKHEKTYTIQKTGKNLKLHSIIAKMLIALGIILILSGNEDDHRIVWGCLSSLFGFAYLAITRIRVWWNHE